MKMISLVPTLLLTLLAATSAQAQLGTAFALQGQLGTNAPGNPGQGGQADLSFSLYDAAAGGQQIGNTLFMDNVEIRGGWFSVELDFGPAFDGTPYWIEVARRQGGGQGAGYAVVGSRIPVLAVPYAQYSITAGWAAEADHALRSRPRGGRRSRHRLRPRDRCRPRSSRRTKLRKPTMPRSNHPKPTMRPDQIERRRRIGHWRRSTRSRRKPLPTRILWTLSIPRRFFGSPEEPSTATLP